MYSDISFMFRYLVVVQVRGDWTLKHHFKKTTKEALIGDLPTDMQVKVWVCMLGQII